MSDYSKNCESLTDKYVRFQSFCMFCFKCTTENSNHSKTSSSINKFVKFLYRFVEQDEISHDDGVRGLGCCGDCEFIINSFCQEYHQLKCVELQLEWRLSKLVNIMKIANRVPSRIQQLRGLFAKGHHGHGGRNLVKQSHNRIKDVNEDKLKSFKKFRQRLLRKCSLRISKSQPRVQLERVATQGTASAVTGNRAIIAEGLGDQSFELEDDVLSISESGEQVIVMKVAENVVEVASTSTIMKQIDEDFENVDGCGFRPPVAVDQYDENLFFKVENDSDCRSGENNFDNLSPDDSHLVAEHDDNEDVVVHQTANGTCNENVASQITDTELANFHQDTYPPSVVAAHCKPSSTKFQINDDVGRSWDADTDMSVDEGEFPAELLENGRGMGSGSGYGQDNFDCGLHEDGCQYDNDKSEVQKQLITKGDFSQKNEQSHVIKQEGAFSPVQVDTKQYSLRKRQKVVYAKKAQEKKYRSLTSEHGEESDEVEASSLSNFSDTDTREGSDTEQTPNRVQKLSCTLKNSGAPEPLFCNLDGCDFKFYKSITALAEEEHMQLHSKGEHKCNFCDAVLDNVIKLIAHETDSHYPARKRKRFAGQKFFLCTRCHFKTRNIYKYHWHFAETHVSGFKGRISGEKCDGALEEDFECTICQMVYLKKNLDVHLKWYHDTANVDPSKVINCSVANCSAYFKEKWQLLRHVKLAHGTVIVYDEEKESDCLEVVKLTENDVEKTIYKCKLCPREYSVFGNYRSHKQKYHNSDIVQLPTNFICPISHCKERFASLEALETHRKLHGTFTCIFCDVVKDNAAELAVHETEHAVRSNDQIKNKNGLICHFHCSRCNDSFAGKKWLIIHFVQSHLQLSATTSICPICKAESTTTNSKQPLFDFSSTKGNHYKNYHDTTGLDPSEIFTCHKCPAYFNKSWQLTVHLVTIHYKNICPECGKFAQEKRRIRPENFRRHVENVHPHVDAFPHLSFRCTWKAEKPCRARFGTQKELDLHEMGHSTREENRNVLVNCPKCDKKLSTREKLAQHLSTVHQPPAHMCSECGKTFKTNSVLMEHMERHKGPEAWKFQCGTCGKKFAKKNTLENHSRTHLKEKPFVCQFCGLQYTQRSNLKNHLKKIHEEEYDEMDDGNTFKVEVGTNFMTTM